MVLARELGRELDVRRARIADLLHRHGGIGDPDAFHAAVNVIFHGYESAVYDRIHGGMWRSLPVVMHALAEAIVPVCQPLRLLDVGCGTGLATALLLASPLGARIQSVDLLDTSREMIALARRRRWRVPVRTMIGQLADVTDRYDIVVASSVLHHIADLPAFLDQVVMHLAPGGVFLHQQDPNGAADSDVVSTRVARRREANRLRRMSLWRRIRNRFVDDNRYLQQTNDALIAAGWIAAPLSDVDLWAITDIHVDERGLSILDLAAVLEPRLTCLTTRTYAFFGKMTSELPAALRAEDEQLWRSRDPNGTIFCGAWRVE